MAIIKHANPCGAALAPILAEAYAAGARVRPRLGLRRRRGPGRAVHRGGGPGRGRRAPGRRHRGAVVRARRRRRPGGPAQGHPPARGARRTAARRSSCAASGAASSSRTPTVWPRARSDWQVATKAAPTDDQWRDIELAWRVCARTSSNAIVVVRRRPGPRGRGRPAEPGGGGRDRRAQGGGPGPGRGGRQRRLLPLPRRARRAGRGRGGRRGPARGIGAETARWWPPPTSTAWPWCSPASATSGTEGAAVTARILDGEALAARIRAEVAERVARLRRRGHPARAGHHPGGRRPRQRALRGDEARRLRGGRHRRRSHEHLPAETSQDELEAVIARFNADPAVHAYLVQLPLPDRASTRRPRCWPWTPPRTSTACTP